MTNIKLAKPFWQALGIGAIAGLRSASATALTSHLFSHHHSKRLEHSPLRFIQSNKVALALKCIAITEFIGDKLPKTPNRIALPALSFRILSGAVTGASIYKASGNRPYVGALIGAGAAALATFGSFYLRKATVHSTKLLDPVVGAIEDALVLEQARGWLKRPDKPVINPQQAGVLYYSNLFVIWVMRGGGVAVCM